MTNKHKFILLSVYKTAFVCTIFDNQKLSVIFFFGLSTNFFSFFANTTYHANPFFVVADCPLWPINETEYECKGSMNQRICKRRQKCSGIQFPHHITALHCVAGQGWSYMSPQSIAVLPMNLFRLPICLR